MAGFPRNFPWVFPWQKDKKFLSSKIWGCKAPELSWFFQATKIESNSLKNIFMDKSSASAEGEAPEKGLDLEEGIAPPLVLLIGAFYQLS